MSTSLRAVALVIDGDLQLNTPVDTGRAKLNWQASVNAPIDAEIALGARRAGAESLPPTRPESIIYITNNVPYIRRLNDGHSKQQPAGFVERAVERGRLSVL